MLRWLSQGPEKETLPVTGGSKRSSNRRKRKNNRKKKSTLSSHPDYPTPQELSQIASLLTKEGRLKDGDDSTMVVVYVCPIYREDNYTICGDVTSV